MAAPAVLGNDVCRERVRTASHLRRPTVDTAPDGLPGTDQPSKPQSRRECFRETANAHHPVAIRQRIEAGRHHSLKREVTIDIILYNQDAILTSQPGDIEAPRLRQREASLVVKV